MVVLSAAVITRNGKVLVARQFMAMTKLRIEGLLSAFPKLVSSGGEHTFIETENVRYLYQPLEQLYIVLITNKQSNILEDLDSLRLVARLVPEFCHGHDEAAVTSNAFQLVFALDEVILVGYRENISIQQVRTCTEMDSHEAKLQKIIKASKEDDARVKSRQMAKEIEQRKQKMSNMQMGVQGPAAASFSGHYGSGLGGGSTSGHNDYSSSHEPAAPSVNAYQTHHEPSTRTQREQHGAVGLKLGRPARQGDQFLQQLASEDNIAIPAANASPMPFAAVPAYVPQTPQEVVRGILVIVEEAVTIVCERDGALSQLDAVGTVKLTIGNPDFSRIQLKVAGVDSAPKGSRFQPHPKIDKANWMQSQSLGLKESDKGFPIGSGNAVPILKWKLSSNDANLCPLQITFWPSQENGRTNVTAEYQAESDRLTLENVIIRIPSPKPEVTQCDGRYVYDVPTRSILWQIGSVEPDSTGTIEWKTDPVDSDGFFPLSISFTSASTLVGVGISAITQVDSNAPIEFETRSSLNIQSFTLQ